MRIGELIPYIDLVVELHPFKLFLDVVPSFQVDTFITRVVWVYFVEDNNAWLAFWSVNGSKIQATLLAVFQIFEARSELKIGWIT